MVLSRDLVASATDVATFLTCEAQYYHSKQKYRTDVLETDRAAADVSSALHNALMKFHVQAEHTYKRHGVPSHAAGQQRLRELFEQFLREKGLSRSMKSVEERLVRLDEGIDRVASLILDDLPGWSRDPDTGDLLVWAEAPLDHGPQIRAVQLGPGQLIRTRPDVIGLRPLAGGRHRVVVRDFKARGDVVVSSGDTGILIRGIWALIETLAPQCRWFLSGRSIEVDDSAIDLETVNVMHAGSEDFLTRASVSAGDLFQHRNRFVDTLYDMQAVLGMPGANDILPSPGGLCLHWCPFLKRCEAGIDHVRKYHGEDELAIRIGPND